MVQSLLAADLEDELVLTAVPFIIGSGKKLFPAIDKPLPFDLVSAVQARRCADMCGHGSPLFITPAH
ncbi:MAG: hypothetical protein KatS3mg114_0146 [Planctomycetaceae bacterium]|nr:MAG: hypothetical protein KatS3mg114_0146 [Planctomycetaceae bacterium]